MNEPVSKRPHAHSHIEIHPSQVVVVLTSQICSRRPRQSNQHAAAPASRSAVAVQTLAVNRGKRVVGRLVEFLE